MQITIGTEDGTTYQIERNPQITGKQIGDVIQGEKLDLDGYELEITGGSDSSGFPMRESIEGSERTREVLESGQGIDTEESGMRRRKSVRGKRASVEIQQLNTKVVEKGSDPLEEAIEE